MKFVAILSLVLLLEVAQATCPTIVCDPKDVKWTDGVCGMVDPTNANQYDANTSACKSSQQCTYSYPDVSQCKDPTPNTLFGFPGEKCDSSYPCQNGVSCDSNKCKALASGATCINIYDCGVTMTCATIGVTTKTCVDLVPVGGKCYLSSDCVQNAGCLGAAPEATPPTQGTCVAYLSIAPQAAAAADCVAPDANLVQSFYCQSGYCFQNEGKFYCSDIVASASTPPVTCTVGTPCTSNADSVAKTTLSEPCLCGWSGNSYCPLFPGDSDMTTLATYQANFLKSSQLQQCNSVRNKGAAPMYVGDWCWQYTYDPSSKELYAYYKTLYYQNIINADKCAVKTFARNIYDAEEASSWLLLSGFAFVLLN